MIVAIACTLSIHIAYNSDMSHEINMRIYQSKLVYVDSSARYTISYSTTSIRITSIYLELFLLVASDRCAYRLALGEEVKSW
jgi:hypothetical protein